MKTKLLLALAFAFTACGSESTMESHENDAPTIEDPTDVPGVQTKTPLTIVNFGDSLTEGPLADTVLGASSFEESFKASLKEAVPVSSLLDFVSSGSIDKTPEELKEIFARPNLVSQSGTAPYSLASRYSENHEVTSLNLSVSGSQISNFQDQLNNLQEKISNGEASSPDVITFGFGANDYCQQNLSNFKDNFQSALVSLSTCLLYTSPSPRDKRQSRMPSSA